jgi:hypothetical protein
VFWEAVTLVRPIGNCLAGIGGGKTRETETAVLGEKGIGFPAWIVELRKVLFAFYNRLRPNTEHQSGDGSGMSPSADWRALTLLAIASPHRAISGPH